MDLLGLGGVFGILNAVQTAEVHEGAAAGTVKSRTQFTYDNAFTTGNVTQETRGVGTTVSHQYAYGTQPVYGNLKQTTDANNNVTQWTYGSVCGLTDLYPTKKEAAYGSAVQRTFTMEYDCSTGLVALERDEDNGTSRTFSYDDLGRPTKVVEAGLRETKTSYDDLNLRVTEKRDLDTKGDGKLITVRHYDQLGRLRLQRQNDQNPLIASDETTGIKVQTRHLSVSGGDYELVSNPFSAGPRPERVGKRPWGGR